MMMIVIVVPTMYTTRRSPAISTTQSSKGKRTDVKTMTSTVYLTISTTKVFGVVLLKPYFSSMTNVL